MIERSAGRAELFETGSAVWPRLNTVFSGERSRTQLKPIWLLPNRIPNLATPSLLHLNIYCVLRMSQALLLAFSMDYLI